MSGGYFGGGGGVRGRMSRGMLPLLAFQVLSEYHRLGRKPPVTAGLILTNSLIYLRPGVLDRLLPTIDQVWFNPHLILKVSPNPLNSSLNLLIPFNSIICMLYCMLLISRYKLQFRLISVENHKLIYFHQIRS